MWPKAVENEEGAGEVSLAKTMGNAALSQHRAKMPNVPCRSYGKPEARKYHDQSEWQSGAKEEAVPSPGPS